MIFDKEDATVASRVMNVTNEHSRGNCSFRVVEKAVLASRTTARPGRHASGAERSIRVVKTQLRTARTVLFQRGLQENLLSVPS